MYNGMQDIGRRAGNQIVNIANELDCSSVSTSTHWNPKFGNFNSLHLLILLLLYII